MKQNKGFILQKKICVLLGKLCVTPDREAFSLSHSRLSSIPHTCDYVYVHPIMNANIKQIAFLMVQY